MSARSARSRSWIGNALVVAALFVVAAWWLIDEDDLRRPDASAARWAVAVVALLAYAALCVVAVRKARRAATAPALAGDDTILVAFATQTGFAEELAGQAASALRAAGHPVDLRSLARVDATTLAATRTGFFVVATYGEGDPPDPSRRFARDVLSGDAALGDLRYGLLALGDRSYANYCGFGRSVDAWLTTQGAKRLFATVEVDNAASDALAAWCERLAPWTGNASSSLEPPRFERWTLTQRRLVNEGSLGAPVFHLSSRPAEGALPTWEAGDIAVVRLPDGEQREYSIASLPLDGGVDLLVRQAVRPDGLVGHGAQWLTSTMAIGATTDLRIRANHGFRLEGVADATPLILIGNGTGLAGLRAHLKARVARGARRNWLFFGERNAAFDRPYADELAAWLRSGALQRVDYAYSRDAEARVHVQHRLLAERTAVAEWLADGAVVLVCGSATGMAGGVDAALADIVGASALDAMTSERRYRRDVY